jgi:branched-chain amino acid transport system substrate-binding protein
MVLHAVARSGSTRAEDIRAELATHPFDAPQGRVRLDPDNGHFYLWPRIGRAGADAQFTIVEQSLSEMKPDPYMVSHSLEDWLAPGEVDPVVKAG